MCIRNFYLTLPRERNLMIYDMIGLGMQNLLLFGLGMQEIIVIALIVLLLFGGKKIPELMKGLGKGVKSFKEGMNDISEVGEAEERSQKTVEKGEKE